MPLSRVTDRTTALRVPKLRYDILTFQDAVSQLLLQFDLVRGDNRAMVAARQAIVNAYRELPNEADWRYYDRRTTITTEASYSTGTVVYDHCVTPDHEALTRNGWKTHDQLRVGDEILGYDHNSETCSWQPIQAIHRYQHRGKMLEVCRRGRVVLRCSPNHRVPVFYRTGRGSTRRIEKRFVLASELHSEHRVPLAAPLRDEVSGPLDSRLASVLGWCVTDGSGLFSGKGYGARIHQSMAVNGHKCGAIQAVVGRCPGRASAPGMVYYQVHPSDQKAICKHITSKAELPALVCRFGIRQAEALKSAMLMAEASTNASGQQVFTQWGGNKPVAEAFQIASLITGQASNIRPQEYDGKIRYQCTPRTSRTIRLLRDNWRWVEYDGVAWCPQVRTGAWVMRCNGSVMITGNSGGSSERLLTLTTGTWPTNAALGSVKISGRYYPVEQRLSGTTVSLSVGNNPGADVASTSYVWFREGYPLPQDYRASGMLVDTTNSTLYPLEYTSPDQALELVRAYSGPQDRADWWTIINDGRYLDQMTLWLIPAPNTARYYELRYKGEGQRLFTERYADGTVSTTSGSTSITGSGTAWTANMQGAVIRFSSVDTLDPTGPAGYYEESADAYNPYVEEGVIHTVTSATAIELGDTARQTLSAVRYTISDPLDIDSKAMYSALMALASFHFARLTGRDDVGMYRQLWMDELRRAKEADYRTNTYKLGTTLRSVIGEVDARPD